MTRIILPALVCIACSDPKSGASFPPLLGKRSESTVAYFTSSCDKTFAPVDRYTEGDTKQYAKLMSSRSGSMETYDCDMSSGTRYEISFAFGQVMGIGIYARTEAEQVSVFDRVFARIVPTDLRDAIRRSISDPSQLQVSTSEGMIEVKSTKGATSWLVRRNWH
jgi:hypothetical protein